jgi:hypothetical protein
MLIGWVRKIFGGVGHTCNRFRHAGFSLRRMGQLIPCEINELCEAVDLKPHVKW